MSDSEPPSVSGTPVFEPLAPGALLGPSWQEQDGILRDLWMQNKTPQEISQILSRSVAAIMTRAARLGLPRRSAPGRKPGTRRLTTEERGQLPGGQASYTAAPRNQAPRAAASDGTGAPQSSPRVCLMCLRSFQSMGRHNRICPSCKSSGEYASATSMADIHFPV